MDYIQAVEREQERRKATDGLIADLLKVVKDSQWRVRHCAENTYCPYCLSEEQDSRLSYDQEYEGHNPGCPLASLMEKAEKYIGGEIVPPERLELVKAPCCQYLDEE